jgi:hypothetical protein
MVALCRFFDRHMEQLEAGTYRPCVDDALLNCHNTLPWAAKILDAAMQSGCFPYVLQEDRDKPFRTSDDLRVEEKRRAQAQAAADATSSAAPSAEGSVATASATQETGGAEATAGAAADSSSSTVADASAVNTQRTASAGRRWGAHNHHQQHTRRRQWSGEQRLR